MVENGLELFAEQLPIVTDENNWQFWVAPTALLDERFPKQKTLGLAGLRQFGSGSRLDAALSKIEEFATTRNSAAGR